MINMSEYKEIVKLRNIGKTHKEIAGQLNISRKTVGRYLRTGGIPQYLRKARTGEDPFMNYEQMANELLAKKPDMDMKDLFGRLRERGYVGSYRTMCRRTELLRQQLKCKPTYFERTKVPGRIMEGDFTELKGIKIGGQERVVHLWVVVLPYSNRIFATPFFQETFECFAEGSREAFEENGGVAEIYRLDNLTPVVTKILKGGRETTKKFKSFQNHYGFKVHFCNPASGWEKGSVESTNSHLKRKLESDIAVGDLVFTSLDSFRVFVHETCRKLNNAEGVTEAFQNEQLCALPQTAFESYQTSIAKVSKYSTVVVGNEGHRYSAPSTYVGCRIEVRTYPAKVVLLFQGQVIATHNRIYSDNKKVSIQIEHVINELCRKPGVAQEWKYKGSVS